MSEEEFYSGLISEKYNYHARIIPRDQISQIIQRVIISKARRFVCLITPYWTKAGIRELNLIPLIQQKLKNNIDVYLFSRYDADPKKLHKENIEIFRSLFFDNKIINCWLVRNLHGKLYYNEKYILLTSANFTTTSLGFAWGKYENNFEEGVLLKLKRIQKDKVTSLGFSNLNPFMIPPFYYMKKNSKLSEFPKNRFLKGCGYHTTSEIEIPALFSFPEMMKDWLLSTETISLYERKNILRNKLIHLGEFEDFCPICKDDDCGYSRTYICHKYGIEYPEMSDHCKHIFDCEKGPFFKTHEFYKLRCPITVFYCPKENIFYDPAENKFREKGVLISGTDARDEFFYREIGHPEAIENIIIYCPKCKSILEEHDKSVYFSGWDLDMGSNTDYEIELYKCPDCNNFRLKNCPCCDDSFTIFDISSKHYFCEKRNNYYPFQLIDS